MRKLNRRWLVLSTIFLLSAPAMAQQANDSVDTYQNHTVSTTVSVQGRDTLIVSDVTVTSTGKLKLKSPSLTIVTGNLEVFLGGVLEINGDYQWHLIYSHDSSGNVIRRRKE